MLVRLAWGARSRSRVEAPAQLLEQNEELLRAIAALSENSDVRSKQDIITLLRQEIANFRQVISNLRAALGEDAAKEAM